MSATSVTSGMDIGEVSRRSGLPASALRYYEERGLIASTGRRGLRRTFDEGVLERLALIALGRAAGFSLDEIALMIAPDGTPRIDRAWLDARADELDQTIRRLATLRDALRHAAACPAPSHMECRHFRRIVRLAGSGRLGAPHGRAGQSRRPPASSRATRPH
jgi:DNA-binding transcriptional MerR regulator